VDRSMMRALDVHNKGAYARWIPILGMALVGFGVVMMVVAAWPDIVKLLGLRDFLSSTPLVPARAPASDSTITTTEFSLVDAFVFPVEERFRLGISMPMGATQRYDLKALGVGWVMDWRAQTSPDLPPDVAYAQTVRMSEGGLTPDAEVLMVIAAANPGALWLVANEGDVRWQDDVVPETYARLYHEAYMAIKAGDPTAVVAVGGIAQPTPLRLRYIEQVLAIYQIEFGQPLPTQAWHIHNYMLREERDSWGVDIPAGLPDDTGILYEVEDSGDLQTFRAQIYDFRRWMAARGYRELPLIISEYGIPMPPDYGFPLERVAAFLQETWEFFLTATDPDIGNPYDGDRLVQQWCWFSLADPLYPTGDLVNIQTGEWTPLGQIWIAYQAPR
jgi:hypothetical protein